MIRNTAREEIFLPHGAAAWLREKLLQRLDEGCERGGLIGGN
jgi:hypothetical protein